MNTPFTAGIDTSTYLSFQACAAAIAGCAGEDRRQGENVEGTYNSGLVATSLVVAILAAYTALDMADRVNRSPRKTALLWLLAGGLAMGLGVWSMHFIGMLAFRLPIPTGYDPLMTFISMGASVVSSTFALWLVSQATLPAWRIVPGGVLMGLGIASMHYLGMEAMQMQPGIDYRPGWFIASIAVAVGASLVALRVFFVMRNQQRWQLRLAAASLLGAAIVGMHYTGMAAAHFPAGAVCGAAENLNAVNPDILAVVVTLVTVAGLGVVLSLSLMDRKMESRMLRMRNAMLSMSLEEATAELSQASLRDPLTRLPNRQRLVRILSERLDEAASRGRQVSLYIIDIDDFQKINDAYGHRLGDQLLMTVAEHLNDFARSGELTARTGSDEFVLVAQHDSQEDAEVLASRLLDTLSGEVVLEGHAIVLSVTLGLTTTFEDPSPEDAETLLSRADTAMRQAKRMGRQQWQCYRPWMNEKSQEHLLLLTQLRQAIKLGLLALNYQPKLRSRDNGIVGAEAHLCWEHPEHGQISGDRVHALADRAGQTRELGHWIVEQACSQLGLWRRAGQMDWSVSVNLPSRLFQDPSLVDHIRQCLDRHAVPSRNLILEISEGMLDQDNGNNLSVINSLASLGVGIAIDDFGTGHASLLHLKHLPATELKIGAPFLQEMTPGSTDAAIISALIGMVHALDMCVVASSVSNRDQRLQLDRMGCDFLQGPLIGMTVPPSRFIQLYASRPLSVLDARTDGIEGLGSPQFPPQPG